MIDLDSYRATFWMKDSKKIGVIHSYHNYDCNKPQLWGNLLNATVIPSAGLYKKNYLRLW